VKINLSDIQKLESLAAKGASINIDASTLLELREALEWARKAYATLVTINTIGETRATAWSTQELIVSAPDEVKS
jgi:hypothetical protein